MRGMADRLRVGMDVPNKAARDVQVYRMAAVSSGSFTAQQAGEYTVLGWSNGAASVGSGQLGVRVLPLVRGETVSFSYSAPLLTIIFPRGLTSMVVPDFGGGSPSGCDIFVAGSPPGQPGSNAYGPGGRADATHGGAPGWRTVRGGDGQASLGERTPGGAGGVGMIITVRNFG